MEVLTRPTENLEMELNRKLGPFEHLLWVVDQWTPRHFILVARIEGSSISAENLQAALSQCQRRHPILRATIQVNDDGIPEFIPSSSPMGLTVVRRVNDTHWLQEVETQLALPIEPGARPLLRVVLVQGEAVSELILVVHHAIGDGASAMYLVRDLLESMEGHEVEELAPRPALEALLHRQPTIPMSQRQPPEMSSGVAARLDRPKNACLQIFEIESGELDRILSRCRREGTTFQGALLSALLLTLPREGTVSCLAPINVRKLLPNVTDDFGLYISSGMATLDRNAMPDFWSLARSSRQQVVQAFDPRALHNKALAMALVVAGRPNPQTAYERVWRNFGYSTVLTNLGRFPGTSELKRYRVTAAYPILSPELEPVVAVATADRRACITVCSPPELAARSSKFLDHLSRHAR